MADHILEARHIKKYFPITPDYLIRAVDDVTFHMSRDEIVGLVGESGCGKSTLARTLMRLYKPTDGKIIYKGWDLTDPQVLREHEKEIQSSMQLIFQDADGALNPRMTAGESISEALLLTGRCRNQGEADTLVQELLHQVGLEGRYSNAYPGELSGGQRQRIGIARCIGVQPDLIIADEPLAALDVSIQAQIINLLKDLQGQFHFSMLFIAHDLSMVRYLSNRVIVMYQGKVVETGTTEEVFTNPVNLYTQVLLASALQPDPSYERTKQIPEFDPDQIYLDEKMVEISPGHYVRTAPAAHE